MSDVFLWVRTAGEFVKSCSSHMMGQGSVGATAALAELCKAYVDPITGETSCQSLMQDPECTNDGTTDVNGLVMQVVAGVDSATQAELCEGSCWPDISRVYAAIFQQWALFDTSVAHMADALKLTCSVEYPFGILSVDVSEDHTVQGLDNTIHVKLRSTVDLTHGTRITLTGINGKAKEGTPILKGPGTSSFALLSWNQPECTQWCPSAGLCAGGKCSATCGAEGKAPDHRCIQWCDVDGVLVIEQTASTVSGDQDVMLSFEVVNPSVRQAPKTIQVAACAPGLSLDINSGAGPVLTADDEPRFTAFFAEPLPCDCLGGEVYLI